MNADTRSFTKFRMLGTGRTIGDILKSRKCAGCGKELGEGEEYLCSNCRPL